MKRKEGLTIEAIKRVKKVKTDKQNRQKKANWSGLPFILPSFVGMVIFILIPFLDVIRRSFTGAVSEEWTGLDNYRTIFGNKAFQLAVKNTLRFEAVCIPLLILLSLLAAVFLVKQTRFMHLMKSSLLIPMAIPVASVVLLWRVLFHESGMLNGILNAVHITGPDWMNTKYAFWVLVFSYVWKNLGYDVVLWVAGLSAIPSNLYEAARVDGAGDWQCFWKITLPNVLPSLFTIAVLSILNSFKVFREAYLVAGDYPDESMYLLQHLFNNWFRDLSLDKMSAAAVINALAIFALVLLLRKAWNTER